MRKFIPVVLMIGALASTGCERQTGAGAPAGNTHADKAAETPPATTAIPEVPQEAALDEAVSEEADVEPQDIEPGKWEVTTRTIDRTTAKTEPARTVALCLTPAQATKGPDELLRQVNVTRIDRQEAGVADEPGTGPASELPAPSKRKSESSSSFTSTSFAIDHTTQLSGANTVSQTIHVEGRRVGVCDTR